MNHLRQQNYRNENAESNYWNNIWKNGLKSLRRDPLEKKKWYDQLINYIPNFIKKRVAVLKAKLWAFLELIISGGGKKTRRSI